MTNRNALARIDPRSNRVTALTPLPSGPLTVAFGAGSLWVAPLPPFGGSTVDRVDPSTGRIEGRLGGRIGSLIAVADGHLWTITSEGVLRRLAHSV